MSHTVFVSYEIAPTTPGGVGVFVSAAAGVLLRDGHRVTLLLDLSEGEFDRWTAIDSSSLDARALLRSRRVEACCADIGTGRDAFPSEAHWRSYRFAFALARLHAEAPADFVEFVDYCGAAYYTLVGRAADPARYPPRVAVRLHNTIEIIDRRVAGDFAPFRVNDYALERAALALADVVLTPGQRFWDDEAASLYPAVDPARVQISFPVRRALSRVPGAGEGRDVVYVGRVSTFKGMDRVLHAAVAVLGDPAFDRLVRRFVVIGPGETVSSSQSENDILAIADGLPPERLLLPGRQSEVEIRRYFAEAVVAIFPNRMESFCYAAHEAHMAGVPLILSDTPAFRDHFVEGDSALFFDGTVGDLVETLRRCLGDPDLRARLSDSVEAHRDRYLRHDYDRHLAIPPFTAVAPAAERIGLVVVPSATAGAARATADDLAAALPSATVWHLTPADGPGIRAFGAYKKIWDQAGHAVVAATQALPPAVAFVAAGTTGAAAFLATATRMLGNEPRLSAVFSARTGTAAIAPERLDAPGGIIGAVLRVAGRATLADLFEDGSDLTEMAALLRRREAGGVLVDHPLLGPSGAAAVPGAPGAAPAGSARARLLRRFAWSHDRVRLADELADRATVATRLHPVDPNADAEDQAATEPGAFVMRVPKTVGAGSMPNRVTILALRRLPGGPPMERAELQLSGRWRQVRVPDRPEVMLVSEGGQLAIAGVDDPVMTLLLGPDQGVVVFAQGGRAVRLDLGHANHWQVCTSVSDLFALSRTADGTAPAVSGRLLLHGGLAVELRAALSRGGRHLAVLETPRDRILAEALGAANEGEGWVLPDALRSDAAAVGRAIAGAVAGHDLHAVAAFGGVGLLPLIEALLLQQPSAGVDYTLRPDLSWMAGGWEWLRATAALAARHPGRLRLRTGLRAMTETLRLLGEPAEQVPVRLPLPTVRPPPGPVSLVLSDRSPGVASCGHIAVAAAILAGTDAVSCLYLPRAQTGMVRIVERFGAGQKVSIYDEAETLLPGLAGSCFIYCCPFADTTVDPMALRALGLGGLALVASGALVYPDATRRILEVAHWEDSMHIADHLRRAIDGYDTLLGPSGAMAVPA